MAKSEPSPLCRAICTCSILAMGLLLFFLLGVWATHLYVRFTPVYSDIECRFEQPILNGVTGQWAISLTNRLTCDNPNPYAVSMSSGHGGEVFVGRAMAPVAAVRRIPHSMLPARGTGSIEAHVVMTPTPDVVQSLLSMGFSDTIPIYMNNSMDVGIDINFLFGRFVTTRSFDKECGLNMEGFGNAMSRLIGGGGQSRLGPMACAESFSDLSLPPVDAPGSREAGGSLAISAVSLDPEAIAQAQRAKNVGLGVAMAIGYGVGLPLLAVGCWRLWRQLRNKEQAVPQPSWNVELPTILGGRAGAGNPWKGPRAHASDREVRTKTGPHDPRSVQFAPAPPTETLEV